MRNPEFYVMRHFSHFVRPGAVRLPVHGHLTGKAVAFRNPDGSRVAVVGNGLPRARRCTLIAGAARCTVELPAYSFSTFVIG